VALPGQTHLTKVHLVDPGGAQGHAAAIRQLLQQRVAQRVALALDVEHQRRGLVAHAAHHAVVDGLLYERRVGGHQLHLQQQQQQQQQQQVLEAGREMLPCICNQGANLCCDLP
jgi:hypothetical protein